MFAWLPLMTIKGWLMLLENIFKVLAGSVVKPTFPGTYWIIRLKHYIRKLRKNCTSFMRLLTLRVLVKSETTLSKHM